MGRGISHLHTRRANGRRALRRDRTESPRLRVPPVLPHPPIEVAITRDNPPLSSTLDDPHYSNVTIMGRPPRSIRENRHNPILGGRRRHRCGFTIEPLVGGGELAIKFCLAVGRGRAAKPTDGLRLRLWFINNRRIASLPSFVMFVQFIFGIYLSTCFAL